MTTLHLRSKRAALLGISLLFTASTAQAQRVVLAGGLKDSLQDHLIQGVGKRLKDPQGPPIGSLDSTESLHWVANQGQGAEGEARFALVRQDAVDDHFRNDATTPVRVVGRVAYEYLHIVVRESLHIESPADLARRRVWAGEKGSALNSTAMHVLDSLGVGLEPLTYKDIEGLAPDDAWAEGYANQKLTDWLANRKLDAAIVMAPARSPEISNLILRGKCYLLPLDRRTLRRLADEDGTSDPFLRDVAFGAIPGWSYFNQGAAFSTVAVPLLLVTHMGTNPDLAKRVLSAASEEWKSVGNPPAPWKSETQSGLRFLVRRETPSHTGIVVVALLALSAISTVRFAPKMRWSWLRRWARRIRNFCHHYKLLCIASAALLVGMVIITGLIYLAERDINENFSSLWESWWSITVYIFSGLEDRVPYTIKGHILVTVGLLLGAICSTIFTGWTTAFFIRRERRMPPKLEGHCLLLNWNERGKELVRELHHPVLQRSDRTLEIVVLNDHPLEEAFEEVYLRIGDPTDAVALRQANAASAKTIVILANEEHGDERTIRSILQLRRIAREAGRDDLHVVAELIDAANDFTVEELARDFPGSLESVSGLRLRTCLLSQAVINEGIIGVYKDLLSVEDESNEVYTAPIPPEAVGTSFHEYAATVIRSSAEGSPIIPIGIKRPGLRKVLTNPRAGKDSVKLQEDDRLVLIAYGPPGKEALPKPEASPAGSDAQA